MWALERRGITALMYLDDLIVIGRGPKRVQAQFHEACTLITDLGLRIAAHKVQPPAPAMTWLGIRIDTVTKEISIPPLKLDFIQRGLAAAVRSPSPTAKHHRLHKSPIQSSCCLLDALWSAHGPHVLFF